LVQSIYYEHVGIDPNTTFFITVSTGIGGGGPKRDLDEVGHIIVDGCFPGLTLLCGCGTYGCIETYASGEGIKNQALNILNLFFEDQTTFEKLNIFENIRTENRHNLQQIVDCSELKHLYKDKMNINAKRIFELANLDKTKDTTDKFAYYLVETAAERFAKVLVSLSNIHGIERFGIGGSVVINNPRYLDIVRQNMLLLHKCSTNIFKSNLEIEVSPLGEYITDYGALFLVVHSLHKENWIGTIIRLQHNHSEEQKK
jgi:predicted NBD/HSP70 family sugar kinase